MTTPQSSPSRKVLSTVPEESELDLEEQPISVWEPSWDEDDWTSSTAATGILGIESLCLEDAEAQAQVEWLKQVISAIRNIRGEANIKPNREVPVLLQGGDSTDQDRAEATAVMLKKLANVADLSWVENGTEPPPHALGLVGNLKILIPLAGLIDVTEETARIDKEIEKVQQEITRIEKKLGNENFVAKAPAEVVDKERAKADALQVKVDTLASQRTKLKSLTDG